MKTKLIPMFLLLNALGACGLDAAGESDDIVPSMDDGDAVEPDDAETPHRVPRAPQREPVPEDDGDIQATCGSPENTRPEVVVFTGEPLTMFEGDTVTLRAVVKDAEGNLDHVRLMTYANESLGDFEQLDAEHFEIEVSWALLAASFDIDWPESTLEWKFTAEAFDNEGALGVRFTSIWLRCDEGEVLCDGTCALNC